MRLEERAALLERLSALVDRGVAAGPALAALADPAESSRGARRAASRAAALLAEGAPLPRALEAAGVVGPADAALLAAGDGTAALGRGLRLLALDLRGRADIVETVGTLLIGPAWKLGVGFLLGALLVVLESQALGLALGVGPVSTVRSFSGLWTMAPPPPPAHDAALLLDGPRAAALLAACGAAVGLLVAVATARAILRTARGRMVLEALGRQMPGVEGMLQDAQSARFLRGLGCGLAAGLPLPDALDRAAGALPPGLAAAEAQATVPPAREGAGLGDCLAPAGFLDGTSRWLIDEATRRPDLPGELLALAERRQERFLEDAQVAAPIVAGLADAGVGLGLLIGLAVILGAAVLG